LEVGPALAILARIAIVNGGEPPWSIQPEQNACRGQQQYDYPNDDGEMLHTTGSSS
jgi:hypothetical protein